MYKGYDISSEFQKFCCEEASDINSPMMKELMEAGIKAWENLETDDVLKVSNVKIKSTDKAEIPVKILEPHNIKKNAPCLVYYHGGGFLSRTSVYQVLNVRKYALETPCKVVVADYRVGPEYVYPTPANDCYSTLLWTAKNAKKLGINKNRIAVGGDSAGGALAASISQMSRDNNGPHIRFQMLNYPVTDFRMDDESMKRFDDTPIWNSKLNKFMWDSYLKNGYDKDHPGYAAPLLAESLKNLPRAYIETAEFDCLKDQGMHYAQRLEASGVPVQFVQTKGTIHAYDAERNSTITQKYLKIRIKALRKAFRIR